MTWPEPAAFVAAARDVKLKLCKRSRMTMSSRNSFLSTCPCCAGPCHHPNSTMAKVATPRRWLRRMNCVFARSPPCGMTAVADEARVVVPRQAEAEAAVDIEAGGGLDDAVSIVNYSPFSREDVAAATIQAYFRGHMARKAFRALKSLVRLQAFARGSYMRKQADVAIQCMQVLVRLQVRVRARQLLNMSKED